MVFSMLLPWLSPARPRVCLRHGHSGRITSALSSVNWDTRRFSCLSARYLFSALRSCSATRSSLSSQQRGLRRFVHACSHGLPMLEVALGAGVHRLKPLRGFRDSRVADGRSRRSTGRAASSAAVNADVVRSGRARATLRMVLALGVGFILTPACAAEFVTRDPLKAFVHAAYPLGDDYFIRGNEDTVIFRCPLTRAQRPFEGVALSEISIWGNRAGPWEVFRSRTDGTFVYVETGQISELSCLESCRTKEYLVSGQCTWSRGWPKQ